jgi:hypothetical protein
MGFGPVLQRCIATLHRGVVASFLIHFVSLSCPEFSIHQGDPPFSILFCINLEHFLVVLEHCLWGLSLGNLKEVANSYMDDINESEEDDEDIVLMDEICRSFEAASVVVLNHNCKSVILGLST